MARDLFSRYIWIIDTIKRYGRISRKELNEKWSKSSFSNGETLPRRTFYNYRNAIEQLFNINIECDTSTFEYYIAEENDNYNESATDWLLNSAAISNVLNESRDISDRIYLENVPSAREFLSPIIGAIKDNHPIKFTYRPFSRVYETPNIILEPYFLKIFRQRWYVTGRNVKDDKIKTYALDRITKIEISPDTYSVPDDFNADDFLKYTFGIVFSHGDVKNVTIKADSQQAKYLRALPLHHTQQEAIHDNYSLFQYKLRITSDFIQELLSLGASITVLEPRELRAMMIDNLQKTLNNYNS